MAAFVLLYRNSLALVLLLGVLASTACTTGDSASSVGKADRLRRQKNYPAALEAFDEILAKTPRNTDALVGRGQTREDSGDVAKALEDYQKALAINSKHVTANLLEGNAYRRLGKIHEAVLSVERAKQLSPGEGWIANLLAELAEQAGDMKKAQENYELAIDLNRSDSEFVLDLARFYDRRGMASEALVQYGNFLALHRGLDEKALKRHAQEFEFVNGRIKSLSR